MSRESRKRARKERNALPRNPKVDPVKASRNRDTRWQNLTARGGIRISLVPVGEKIPVDLDDPAAPFALALRLTQGRGVAEA